MNEKIISAISLSNRDFPSFEAKLLDAAKWVEHAARQGAELAVLPEALNLYSGDGPDNPNALNIADVALDDWKNTSEILFEVAVHYKIAATTSVFTKENDSP